jgi:hypothetical protein
MPRRITSILSFHFFPFFLFFPFFTMTSLSEENLILRQGLQIFASEMEQIRAENARLEAHNVANLQAECARLRAERNTAIRALRAKTPTVVPRYILENHVAAEKAKRTDCPILMVPLSECDSVTVSTACGHIFDTDAFKTWSKDHRECAVCRTIVGDTATFRR